MRATACEITNTRSTRADRPMDGFRHTLVGAVTAAGARKVYALGQQLGEDCPGDDCLVYLNTFHMAQELDEALDILGGYPAQVMERELRKLLSRLWEMYLSNYAIQKYREGRPYKGTTPSEGNDTPYYPGKPEPESYVSEALCGHRPQELVAHRRGRR